MIMAMASDHAGYNLKEELKKHLMEKYPSFEIMDLGTDSEESVDYPIYGEACGKAVAGGKADLGIVCCGTGIGISMAANKVKGIRACVCSEPYTAKLSKEHNNSNIIFSVASHPIHGSVIDLPYIPSPIFCAPSSI